MASNTRQKPASKKTTPAPVNEQGRSAPASPTAAIAAAPAPALSQTEQFDRAFAAFHARGYAEALPLFEAAAAGCHLSMAHTASVYARICKQKLGSARPSLSTPEDLYNFAVALMNARKFAEAESYLRQAIALAPSSDHIHYALALSRGLNGDVPGARESLQRAIEINPRNLYAARNDPDFSEIGRVYPLADLLYPGTIGA